jgi:hypothetical protein
MVTFAISRQEPLARHFSWGLGAIGDLHRRPYIHASALDLLHERSEFLLGFRSASRELIE